MGKKKITVEGKGEVFADHFRSYGFDGEFFAFAGRFVYCRKEKNIYRFLCEDRDAGEKRRGEKHRTEQ